MKLKREERAPVAGKREKIIEYLTELPSGTRVSVRALSRELGVSEGTAYKAIKAAEELHIVETRPRAGTVRLGETDGGERGFPLASVIQQLGLTVLAGKEFADVTIGKVVIANGSLDQFKDAIADFDGNILCLVGDRPEIIFYAASRGIHLVISGSHPGEALLDAARKHRACVLTAEQDSAFLYGLMCSNAGMPPGQMSYDLVKDWMKAPPYLYYNDIAADWHSIYRPLFSAVSKCAVVDDELRICGTVDATKVLTTMPSRKISSIYTTDIECLKADESMPVPELADLMIARENSVAFITHGEELSGVVTANDILRYYRRNPSAAGAAPGLRIEMSERDDPGGRSTYLIQLPEKYSATGSELFSAMLSAAHMHCAVLPDKLCRFEAGTFYCQNEAHGGDLMVSCDELRKTENGFILDTEVYDDSASYARCLLTVEVSPSDDSQGGKK